MIGRDRTRRKLEELLKEEYAKGNIPDPGVIAKQLREYTESFDMEGPEFKPTSFTRKSKFDVEAFNTAAAAIYSDLGALYTENVTITSEIVGQLSLQDAYHNSQIKALQVAKFQLNDLLLTSAHGVAALASVGDDFSDVSKVDGANTTATVDLGLGVASLSPQRSATRRISLGHLSSITTVPITVLEPEAKDIRTTRYIGGANFGALFDNTLSAWQFQVLTEAAYSGRTVIEFTFDMHKDKIDVEFSRIDFNPLTPDGVKILILHSRDNINWLALEGYTTPTELTTDIATFRFPTIKAKSIKVILTREVPSGEEGTVNPSSTVSPGAPAASIADIVSDINYPRFTYHFGARSIDFYAMAYAAEEVLQSETLVPDVPFPIGRASIQVVETLPPGTNIKYEVALPPVAGADPAWAEISPINRGETSGAPKIIDFGNILYSSRYQFQYPPASGTGVDTYVNGIPFVDVLPPSLDPTGIDDILPKSGRLWKGVDAWKRNLKEIRQAEIKQVGNKVYFDENDDFQYLYVQDTNEPKIKVGALETFLDQKEDTWYKGYDVDTELILGHAVLTDSFGWFALTPAHAAGVTTGGRDRQTNTTAAAGDPPTLSPFGTDIMAGHSTAGYSIEKVLHVLSDKKQDEDLELNTGAVLRVNTPSTGWGRRISKRDREVLLGLPEYDYVGMVDIDGNIYYGPLAYSRTIRIYLQYEQDGITLKGFFNAKIKKILDTADTGDDFVPYGGVGCRYYYTVEDPEKKLRNADSVSWAIINRDITHLITGISSQTPNIVYLNKVYWWVRPGDRLTITYRRTLDSGEEVLTDTVEVLPYNPGAGIDPAKMPKFTQGIDYEIKKTDYGFAIQRMNNPTSISYPPGASSGGIPLSPDQPTVLTVNFTYRPPDISSWIYSTFFVLERALKKLELTNLALAPSDGDKLLVTAGGNVQDVTHSNLIKDLPAGIVGVTVHSLDIQKFDGTIDELSALYKVLQALDSDGHPVFVKGSRYWRRQVAIPQPMEQISWTDPTRGGPPTNNDYIAVNPDTSPGVWINYNPLDQYLLTQELVGFAPASGVPPTGVGLSTTPGFEFDYKYTSPGAVARATGILMRGTFSRDITRPGDVTPLLDEYNINLA